MKLLLIADLVSPGISLLVHLFCAPKLCSLDQQPPNSIVFLFHSVSSVSVRV